MSQVTIHNALNYIQNTTCLYLDWVDLRLLYLAYKRTFPLKHLIIDGLYNKKLSKDFCKASNLERLTIKDEYNVYSKFLLKNIQYLKKLKEINIYYSNPYARNFRIESEIKKLKQKRSDLKIIYNKSD